MVGYTKVGEGKMCCWVFKKEHLALQEVVGVLKRLEEEKREWDKECWRRPHNMFIPNGSKILVGSYVHLRREGLEGYISDFNNMVKDIWGITKGLWNRGPAIRASDFCNGGCHGWRASGRSEELDRVDGRA